MESKRQAHSQGPRRKIMKIVHLDPEVDDLLRRRDFSQSRIKVRHEGIDVFLTMRSPQDQEGFKQPHLPGILPQHPGDNRPPQRLDIRHIHIPINNNMPPLVDLIPAQVAEELMAQGHFIRHRPRNENRPRPIRPAGR